jgi:putative two-component system response regulator
MPQATILIVDDEPANVTTLVQLLRPAYQVRAANSGAAALRVAASEPKPDLVLLDISMPGMDGYAVLASLRDDPATRDIPVVFITALAAAEDEERGLALGALDYITKPIKPGVILARVRTQLEAKRARDWMRDQNAFLEAEVARRMAETDRTQVVGIRALAHLAEIRDPDTGPHILRTQHYVHELALRLAEQPRFRALLTPRHVDLLTRSAPLHDIGKVGIPDTILRKSGELDAAEWAVMQTHSRLGSDAIERAERDASQPLAFLSVAKEIARWHHERWDGGGYPDGLAGEAIPVSARIMALADVFDALVVPRTYRAALPVEDVRRIIEQGRGSHFDPGMTDVFLAHFDRFVAIAARYSGPDGDEAARPPSRLALP